MTSVRTGRFSAAAQPAQAHDHAVVFVAGSWQAGMTVRSGLRGTAFVVGIPAANPDGVFLYIVTHIYLHARYRFRPRGSLSFAAHYERANCPGSSFGLPPGPTRKGRAFPCRTNPSSSPNRRTPTPNISSFSACWIGGVRTPGRAWSPRWTTSTGRSSGTRCASWRRSGLL